MDAAVRFAFGVSVTVFKSAEKLTLAGTTMLEGSRKVKELLASNHPGSIALLNTILTVVVTGTFVAPLTGVLETKAGATKSVPVPVVKDVDAKAD